MVLNFQDFKERKIVKDSYRQKLVDKISAHYVVTESKKDYDFYLDHVRSGFPIHVLEGILERLEAGIDTASSNA